MNAVHVSDIRTMSAPAGTRVSGRYRIEETIGRGGMSTVYKGFDTTLERPVAIKVMHRDVARDADHLERFRREARAVAKLSSPYVVGVIDAGEDGDGTPFIVLEYIDGETLKDRIRRLGRLPITEAVAYAIEVARGLQAAHERDIVHRDVKPQNVLIDEHGAARVTDFGIARSLRDDGLTADGRVLGTTDYVSPEQALGHQVTPQSDLYSLGVVLYEMLTGEVPFHGETQISVAMHHVRDELPDVQRGRPEVSSALAAIVDNATAKDLGARYATVSDLIADLEDALAIESARAGAMSGEATTVFQSLPPTTRRRVSDRVVHPSRWIAALVALAAAAVVAARPARGSRPARHRDIGRKRSTGIHGGASRSEQRRGLRPRGRRRRARRRSRRGARPRPAQRLGHGDLCGRQPQQGRRGNRRRRQAARRRAADQGRHGDARVVRGRVRGGERQFSPECDRRRSVDQGRVDRRG